MNAEMQPAVSPNARIGYRTRPSKATGAAPDRDAIGYRTCRLPLAVTLILLCLCMAPAWGQGQKVAVVEMHGAITSDLASFVAEQLDLAWQAGYAGVILDIDTTDGSDEAAEAIKSTVLGHSGDLTIAAYVHDHATGPGSLIPVACKTVVMTPGASLGGNPNAPDKMDYKAAAEATGRNPALAAAFVAADNPLPALGVMTAGGALTLTPKQALSNGFADAVGAGYPAVLQKMSLPNASITPIHYDLWLAAARWIVLPWATILLLVIGLVLVIMEMATWHSWGIAGAIGAVVVATIFAAHIAVGHGSWVGVILFVAGLIFLLFETHILPGHGVSALVGLALITFGMYFALGGAEHGGLMTVGTALLTTAGVTIAFFVYLPRSRVWKKIGQPLRQTAADGYVASEDYTGFLGMHGNATTHLRPSGTADIAGIKIPVVSEGGFIDAGTPIEVVLVQGNRIVVRNRD
ncbi:MAG: NfeD family protein [Capsulimonadaceae bacterium]